MAFKLVVGYLALLVSGLTQGLFSSLIMYVIISAPARIYNNYKKRQIKFYPISLILSMSLVLIDLIMRIKNVELVGGILGVIIISIYIYKKENLVEKRDE